MNPKSKEHLEAALYQLKEALRNAHTPDMIIAISDSLIDIANYIEKWEGRLK